MKVFRYTSKFAAITADLELKVLSASPCAKALLNWLLRQCQPGKAVEFELQQFADFTSNGRDRPYSLRHIWRALQELFELEVVQQVKRYTWQIWKVAVIHPSLTNSSQVESVSSQYDQNPSQAESISSQKSLSNPHESVVSVHRDDRESLEEQQTQSTQPLVGVSQGTSQFNRSPEPISSATELSAAAIENRLSNGEAIGDDPAFAAPADTSSDDIDIELIAEAERAIACPLPQGIKQWLLEQDPAIVRAALAAIVQYRQRAPLQNAIAILRSAVQNKWKPRDRPPSTSPPLFQPASWQRETVAATYRLLGIEI